MSEKNQAKYANLDQKDKDLMLILDTVGEKLSPENLVILSSQTLTAFVGMRALEFLKPVLSNFSLEKLLRLYTIGRSLPIKAELSKRLQLKFNSLTHDELMELVSKYRDNADILLLIIRTGKMSLNELILLGNLKTKSGEWLWDAIANQIKKDF